MPLALLPASAQAFAPRSGPTIVLGARVETWLTQALKRINRVKRPLNSVNQVYRCLTETLSGASAIWTLASIMVPKAPDADLRKDSNPLVEAIFNYQLIHVEAYVVHVDMVSQNEIAYKLTQESIDALIEYHRDIYSADAAASTWDWSEKETQLKKLQDDFVQAVNRFVYRTHVRALEGLEDDGAGELLEGRSDEVKTAINNLFQPLLPPPPRIVDVVHPYGAVQQIDGQAGWWQPTGALPLPTSSASPVAQPEMHSAPLEPWRMLGSTPSPTVTTGAESHSPWSAPGLQETHVPSPATTYSQPFSQAYSTAAQTYTTAQTMAPIPSLPLPSTLISQCGPSASTFGFDGLSGFGSAGMSTQYPIQI